MIFITVSVMSLISMVILLLLFAVWAICERRRSCRHTWRPFRPP